MRHQVCTFLIGLMAFTLMVGDVSVSYAQIEEIVVTARKREETAQRIPVAVTTLSGEHLGHYDITTLEDVAATTPQLLIVRGNSGSSATISLRGIGSTYTSIGIEQSVAVNLDGVYYGAGRVINEGFFDVRQIEILKGPQALFFGKNSPAGVISITSNDPGESFEALGRVGYEFEAEEFLAEGILSGPLTDTLGMRLALRGTKMYDGYIENEQPASVYGVLDVATFTPGALPVAAPSNRDLPDERDLLGRLTLSYDPTEDLSFKLKATASSYETASPVWNNELWECPQGGFSQSNPTERCNKDWKVQHTDFPTAMAATNPLLDNEDDHLFQAYDSFGLAGTLDYSMPWLSLTSVLAFHHLKNEWGGDYDFSGAPSVYAGEDTEYDAYSAEARALTTFDSPFNFLLGLYYQRTERWFDQDVLFAGSANSAVTDPANEFVSYEKNSKTDGETTSAFGQVLWQFLPSWELTGGVRYTHETKDSYFIQPYVNPLLGPASPIGLTLFVPGVRVAADQTFNNWSPEATLTWTPTDDLTLYGAYKRGFKSGGFSNSAILGIASTVEDFTFDDEKAIGFEVGVKSTWLGRTLRLNLVAYHYDYEDLQVDFFNSPTFAYITTNAAEAEMDGVELEGEWVPPQVEGLALRGSVAYNRTRYVDFIAPCYAGQTPAQGCTIVGPAPAFTPLQDIGGERTAHAPDWTASLGLDYSRPIGGDLVLAVSGDARFSSEYSVNAFANPGHEQDSYITLDAALRLRDVDERWEVALIGRNLTNEYVLYSSGDAPLSGGGTGTPAGFPGDKTGTMGMPRTIQIQVSTRY